MSLVFIPVSGCIPSRSRVGTPGRPQKDQAPGVINIAHDQGLTGVEQVDIEAEVLPGCPRIRILSGCLNCGDKG